MNQSIPSIPMPAAPPGVDQASFQKAIMETALKAIAEGAGGTPTQSMPPPPPSNPPQEAVLKEEGEVIKLDNEDKLHLENLLLYQQHEGMSRQLEDRRRTEAEQIVNQKQTDLQAFLVKKYNVDLNKQKLEIDPSQGTLTLSTLPQQGGNDVATNN